MTGDPSAGDGRGESGVPSPAWREAPDGGRTAPRRCAHLDAPAGPGPAPGAVCAACAARGRAWRRLRWCATCGHVGCCDSSPGAHAHAHHLATGHPVAVSLAPDEDWAWCFADELFLVPVTAPPDTARRNPVPGHDPPERP
ncbi:UBP-type zinc finger domain-containing protein [Streptomyces sp. NPDC012438]|uniref:UBP-type zinc finger domain-containing protein n=1 Tax=Streptomyces sp. NPDC012438 TaxID=3364833 RepID=UPI0036EA07F7